MIIVDKVLLEESAVSRWSTCKGSLRSDLGEVTYHTWIDGLQLLSLGADTAFLGPVNAFAQSWLESHYRDILLASLRTHGIEVQKIGFVLDSPADAPVAELPSSIPDIRVRPQPCAPRVTSRNRDLLALNPRYTFESFVCGDCNSLAHQAARTVAQSPLKNALSPLILYGGSGLGKTHLMHAIGRAALENGTAQRVVYCSAEQFLRDYMAKVVQGKDPAGFRRAYDEADILLVDDIQFLAKAERTQEELFKLLSRLKQAGKQIVVSSDLLPSRVSGMHRNLLAQFEAGVCCSVTPPSLHTRLDILRRKVKGLPGLEKLPEEVFRYIANRCTRSIREMEGTLLRVFAYRELLGGVLDMSLVRNLLGDAVRDSKRRISVGSIAEAVAEEFGVKPELLGSATRQQSVVLPRKIAMLLCRQLTDASLEFIGLHFHRDYSTVIHAIRSVELQIQEEPELRARVESLRASLAD